MRHLSIRARLTVWYTAILAAGLLAFGLATWIAMRHSLVGAVDENLRQRVESLRRFMDESKSIQEIHEEFDENSALGPGGDLFQVLDATGAWMHRSPELVQNAVEISRHPEPGGAFGDVRVRGRSLRTLSRTVQARGNPYTLQIAVPDDEVNQALTTFRWTLIVLILPMLGLAAAGGAWISRRALQPVTNLSAAAESIDVYSLGKRLAVEPTGDEVQKLADTFNGMLDRLENSFERMVRFTGDASHELRTPVALIRTASEVALRKVRTVEEYQETLRDIGAESERVTTLIGDLLTLARVDNGLGLGERASVDLGQVVSSSAAHMSKLAEAQGMRLLVEACGNGAVVRGDHAALDRVFRILLDNAVKYTTSAADILIRVRRDTDFALVEVQDRGVGIAGEDLPLIFERFYRVDKARSSGGVGLGLAIAQQIVAAHRGRIEVLSKVGEGSTFRVILPVA